MVGDVNIRLDRADDPFSLNFMDTLAAYGLRNHVSTPTHNRGGLLDIVVSREDLQPPPVEAIDAGLSDHLLLRWPASLLRPPPSYSSTTRRSWRLLDPAAFRANLKLSALCQPDAWTGLDVEEMSQLYDAEISALVDRHVPTHTVTCRRRPSDPWFDADCRSAKREVRRLERVARRVDQADVAASTAANDAWTAKRRAYRALQRRKREAFWQFKVESERSAPRQLWKSVDTLLGRGRVPPSGVITAEEFHQFFDEKVEGVRSSTADAPPPVYTPAPDGCRLIDFQPITAEDVFAAIQALPDKQSSKDPIPTCILKRYADDLAPFLVVLFNRSLATGIVPSSFKSAFITPMLKKVDLDPSDPKSYRPISNLSVISKLLERLVASQLLSYIAEAKLLPDLQSAYQAHYSTGTAVLQVMSDILRSLDDGDIALLTLLDLSAAFDTVDHAILLQRLEASYAVRQTWFVLVGRISCYLRSATGISAWVHSVRTLYG